MAGSDEAAAFPLPTIREAFPRTIRLVSSARLREAVMAPLADNKDELDLLAEIEGATSGRLVAEDRGTASLPATELVHGVAHAKFINASFAYAKPWQMNRFNPSDRGAWYSALAVETCIAEVGFHLTRALADANSFHAVVEYREMLASMAGVFVDLRGMPEHACLDPNPAVGYPAGNLVASQARAADLNGIIYPSVRHPGGTCIVALRPNAVQSVVQGGMHRLTWSGSPDYVVEHLS
ncbi:MAG: RES family NAD+ phosphorylase [Sandaracinobacter sp.]